MNDKVSLYDLAMEMSKNMRHSTPEENKKINEYIMSISTPTGFNIFDLYKDKENTDDEQPK
jgi:hypothetical protein